MFIHKDQMTGADTKTRFRTKKVIDWDATLTAWGLIAVAIAVARYVFFS